MKIIKCDVCGEDYRSSEDMIEMLIPASFLEEEGESIAIDVCGWPCVSNVVDSALNRVSQEEEVAEKHTEIPPTPSVDPQMTEKMLAEYTEAVTGVRRR